MDLFVWFVSLISLIIIGYIDKRNQLRELESRLNFTINYNNNFIELLNKKFSNSFDNEKYMWLTERVEKMQKELGARGLISFIDKLAGVQAQNYQLLLNLLPQIKTFDNFNNSIMVGRFQQEIQTCTDMFLKHKGYLDEKILFERKHLFNPFSCLSSGINIVLILPLKILYWLGFIPYNIITKALGSKILKFLNFIVILIGFISAIITIILGWDETVIWIMNIIYK